MIVTRDECARLETRLEQRPDDFSAWLELARLKNIAHQAEDALRAASNAWTLNPASMQALYHKGLALLDLGFAGDAAEAFMSILAIEPLHPGVLMSLGSAYYQTRRLEQAGIIWEQAVRVASDPVEILENLAVCYQRQGDLQKVAEVWERVLARDSSHPLALHHLAALGRRPVPDRSSEEYVIKLFDEFAEDFDVTLDSLGYECPQSLAAIVANNTAPAPSGWRILDAGCGTGLCGPYLRPWAQRLEGVDLSPGMLQKAKARSLYDELHCEEMTRFCERHPAAFDLIMAADSINYFGDLESVAMKIGGSLREGGRCAFSVERLGDETNAGFHLQPHGRFSHRSEYVTACLAAAGLRLIAQTEARIRSERGQPVVAELFLAGR